MLTEPQAQTVDVVVCALVLLGYALYKDATGRGGRQGPNCP